MPTTDDVNGGREARASEAVALCDCPNCGVEDWARVSYAVDDSDVITTESFACMECGIVVSVSLNLDFGQKRLAAIRQDHNEIVEAEDGHREVVFIE